MSPLTDRHLSADLVTDSAAPHTPARPFADTLYAPRGRLQTLTRIGGLHLTPGYPQDAPDGDRLPLGDAGEATVRELATALGAPDATTGNSPTTPGMAGAAQSLRTAAQDAHVDLHLGVPYPCPDGDRLPLGDIDHAGATRLADAIEEHLAGLIEAEDQLRAALETAGVSARQLCADGGTIALGDITVPDGATLLRRLAPDQTVPDVDPDDHSAGDDLARRLTAAVRTVTGGFMDVEYDAYCRRCRCEPALALGRLHPHHAQALTARLAQATA